MKLGIIGFGQAGGKITDRFLRYDRDHGTGIVEGAVAVNTAQADLMGLNHVPEENRIVIGQSRVKGHGVGADNELGAEIAEQDIEEVQSGIDQMQAHELDAFLIIAGLGGGTGSGGAPVLARHLQTIYSEPVYGLGVLPGADEGGIYTLNAARSFQTFVEEVDNLLVFDNDNFRSTGESVQSGYDGINEEIVKRFGTLFSAGEIEALRQSGAVGESVVDASEIINTLRSGGVSSLGFASEEIKQDKKGGLLSRFSNNNEDEVDSTSATNRITSLVRKATLGRLTLNGDIGSTQRALVVVSGPPKYLNRKGIERSRKWLEEQTGSMEVRGGDYPMKNTNHIAATVLLGGMTNVQRIKEMQAVAIEAQENIEELSSENEENLDQLVDSSTVSGEEQDDLRSLF